ncbi:MAG: FAD-binding protein [Acidimicrobiia bacterium]|nr:FAD-binding protein [Acidimicrobiia bacterium]
MPDVDVLVAGAGAAGLSAAIAAAQRGASVVIAEAHETFRSDSNTAMSTSMVPAGGSRWQAAAGIEDSPEQFLSDIQAKTKGRVHETVARALVGVAPELVAWLADDVGVPLELVTDFNYPGHSAYRCHTVPDRAGQTLHRYLLTAAENRGATVMVPLRLVGLRFDSHGDIEGATLENPDRVREEISASRVVLATNGFGANPEMVERHIPEISGALYFGGHGSNGDAIRLAERYDLDVSAMGAYQGHGSVATPHGVLVTWATVMHGAVILDNAARRFADETIGYSEFARLVLDREAGEAWLVLDHAIHEACLRFADYERLVASNAIRWADDEKELASIIGAPESSVSETLTSARQCAVEGRPDQWGRTLWEAPIEPPYGAVRITGALFHTQGGLDIDANAAVLRNREPVPGLYASGGAAVGMSGDGADGYLAGNGLLAALGLGYLAGKAGAG